jgi:two-component system, NarL family, sensor histidine kinase EvgS
MKHVLRSCSLAVSAIGTCLRWLACCALWVFATAIFAAPTEPALRVGVLASFPPFQVWPQDSREPGGADMELLALAAREAGFSQVERLRFERYADMERALRERRIDLMMAVGRSPERDQWLAFSPPYVEVPQALLARRSLTSASVAPDLQGQRVGVVGGFLSETLLRREFPKARTETFGSLEAAVNALAEARIDVVFETLPALQQVVEQQRIEGLHVLRSFAFDEGRLRAAMRQDDAQRLGRLSRALAGVSTAQVERFVQNWSAQPLLTMLPSRFALQGSESSTLAGLGAVRVGLVREYRPYSFVDEAGQMQGLSVDVLREIQRRTDLRIDSIQPYTLAELLAALQAGEVDLALGLTDTLARRQSMLFVGPYLSLPLVIIARQGANFESLAQMQGARLALPRGYFAAQLITARYPGVQIVPCRASAGCLQEIEEGRADASLTDIAGALQRLRQRSGGMPMEIVGLAEEGLADQHSMALHPRLAAAAPALKRALDDVVRHDMPVLRRQWLAVPPVQLGIARERVWRGLAAGGAGLALLLAAGWWYSRSLKTEVSRRREAQQRAEKAALQRERYLAFLAHEVRNSLNAVIGGLVLSRETSGLGGEKAAAVLSLAEGSTRSTLGLLNDLLDYNRIDAGRLSIANAPARLLPLVQAVLEELRPVAVTKGLGLHLDAETGPGIGDWHEFDSVRVGQILRNLVANALKFTAQGEVRVRVSQRDLGSDMVELELAVSDTGPGIAVADQARIFEPYEQGEAGKGQGTGLGLALSQELAKAMGGSLGLRSRPGDGSTFSLRWPAALSQPVPAQPSPTPDASARDSTSPRLLLVEDAPAYALLLSESFQQAGWQVHAVSSLDDALSACAQQEPQAVLCDVHLPDGTAMDLLLRLAAAQGGAAQAMRVVVMSAGVDAQEAHSLREAGSLAVLEKLADARTMVQQVQAALAPRRA